MPRTAVPRAFCGELQLSLVVITIVRAGAPCAALCGARAVTQLPGVTSVSCAGVSSAIFVDPVTSTVAAPFFWVT
ncbi:MAG: hypothetical protein JO191_09715 [Mycobacteriaceae bacterium]|nr:hypothetical protein [Mycobacteriaceae bacterium]